MSDSELLRRLTAMRTTVRRRLVLYGLCVIVGSGLLTLTLIILLDWWLWLPPVLRLAGGAFLVLGGAVVMFRWVVQPLLASITPRALAGRLEQHFPVFGDSLTNTVSFLEVCADDADQSARIGSGALIRRVIDDTERAVQPVPLEEALTQRPLVRCAGLVLLAAAAVAMIAWASPGWYGTGLARYASPFGSADWPRRVEIQPLQGDTKVALGGALLVRMRITRGMNNDLRGIVHVRDSAGETSTFAMQREGPADFYCTIERIVDDLRYWFEAGDDATAATPCRVTVVTPPAVADAAVRVTAPAYAQPRAPTEMDLAGGEVRAVAGSLLTVAVRTDKPVGMDDKARPTARLEFDQSPAVPLELEDRDPVRLTSVFELKQNDTFRIMLQGPDGFENHARQTYRLTVVPDQPPVVTVTEPSAVTEVTPTGSVSLVAGVEDDFGIRQVRLTGEVLNRANSIDVPLTEYPPADPTGAPRNAELRHVWELGFLGLQPGDVVVYGVTVTDNYAYQGEPGQSATSPPLRLKVVSQAEFENHVRDEIAVLEARVRQTMLDQETLRDDSGSLADTLATHAERVSPTTPAESLEELPSRELEPARRLGRRQQRLADQLRRLAERFERVRERMHFNGVFDEPTRRQMEDIARQLSRTASGSMTQASRALERLVEQAWSDTNGKHAEDRSPTVNGRRDRETLRTHIATAGSAQTTAVDELRQVLRWMGRWGDFQEVVAKARDLLDRQQQGRAVAMRQGREVMGKSVGELTDEQQARLRRVVREQKQLAREMDQWLHRSRSLAERIQTKDPTSAEALQRALRTAVAHRVLPRMEQAATALTDNRIMGASLEQRAVESGLATVLDTLEARQVRELAELRKTLDRMLDAVAELLNKQEELMAATREAVQRKSATDAFAVLADEQRAVRRNASQLADQISMSPPAARAAGEMKKAVAPMERAERKLRATTGAPAVADQREARASLEAAIEELRRLAAKAEHQLMQKTLAQTRRKLEDIRDGQQEINETSTELVDIMLARKRLGRADARRTSRLAARQNDLRDQTITVRSELDNAAVYAWVLDRVSESMDDSHKALAARRLNDALVENQHDIVSKLSQLIDAIASIEELPPPDKFVDRGGGGGGSIAKDQPPVPPVAELIVIKTMQETLNEKTAALHAGQPGAEPTEKDLRHARALGREQEQLRELTERVTRQARNRD